MITKKQFKQILKNLEAKQKATNAIVVFELEGSGLEFKLMEVPGAAELDINKEYILHTPGLTTQFEFKEKKDAVH